MVLNRVAEHTIAADRVASHRISWRPEAWHCITWYSTTHCTGMRTRMTTTRTSEEAKTSWRSKRNKVILTEEEESHQATLSIYPHEAGIFFPCAAR
eukprot:5976998-Pyramimonas_sp.AAC.1